MHNEASPLSGRTVTIKTGTHAGCEYRVEDYWDRVSGGKSWMDMGGNPACIIYGVRAGQEGLPIDDEVVYGKIGPFGHLIHVSELP